MELRVAVPDSFAQQASQAVIDVSIIVNHSEFSRSQVRMEVKKQAGSVVERRG